MSMMGIYGIFSHAVPTVVSMVTIMSIYEYQKQHQNETVNSSTKTSI